MSYTKQTWANGDIITAAKLNHIEDGIEAVETELTDDYARTDGSYEGMTVGNAEQLVATVGVEDQVPYNFRTAGGSADIGDRETDMLVGGTIAWNQLIRNGDFNEGTRYWIGSSATLTVTDGVARSTITGAAWNNDIRQNTATVINGHVYLIQALVRQSSTNFSVTFRNPGGQSALNYFSGTEWTKYASFIKATSAAPNGFALTVRENGTGLTDEWFEMQNVNCFDLTQMFGSAVADYIYSLEQATAGAGVAFFRKLFPKPYYEYNAGELLSVNASAHKMVGFNAWDEEWEVGGFNTNTGLKDGQTDRIRSKNFIPCLPNTTYYFKHGTNAGNVLEYDYEKGFIKTNSSPTTFTTSASTHFLTFYMGSAYGNTYKNDICINLSWDGERDGEYEPYVQHTYPLDSSLTLRGIPKLSADNTLYYDGDTYESDGKVTRKYGVYKITGNEPQYVDTNNYVAIKVLNYISAATGDAFVSKGAKYAQTSTNGYLYVITDGMDAAAYKAFCQSNDVYAVYPLATPTTEEADTYQNPQIVDDFGTEEYIVTEQSGVAVPVGHETTYQANLRAKLEMAPDSPDGDGDYIVRQSNGQNSYVPITFPADELPAAPTTDGNYVLKCTVSNGTATFTWATA